jgi:hypothetical protein
MNSARWFGLFLMAFGVVTGSAMYYMRRIAVANDPQSGTAFTVAAVISAIAFGVGLIAFLGNPADPSSGRRAGQARRKKKPIKLPQGDPDL